MFERFFFYCSTSIIILMDSTVPRSVDNGQSSSKSFFSLVKWNIEGIDGIRCRDICFFVFFFTFRLLSFVVQRWYYSYIRDGVAEVYGNSFFFFFFSINIRGFVPSEERFLYGHGGRKRKKIAMERFWYCFLRKPSFFFLKPETHLSAVVFQKENEGMRKQLRQMWTLGTRPSVRQWCSPYFLFSFLLLRGENFIYRLEGNNFKHSLFPVQDEIFLFHFSYCFVSFFRILHIYIYIYFKEISDLRNFIVPLFNWTMGE